MRDLPFAINGHNRIIDHAPPSASSAESNPAADEAVAVQPAALASDAADSVERSEKSKRKSRRRTERENFGENIEKNADYFLKIISISEADSVADEAASVALKGSDAVEQLDQLDKKKGKHRRRIESKLYSETYVKWENICSKSHLVHVPVEDKAFFIDKF